MKNQTIIQVSGLGVPVQSLNQCNQEGFELRWSSDPEVASNARVHVLNSEKELRRFVSLAVDKRFIDTNLLSVVPVRLAEGQTSMSREEAIEAGINADNWDLVRVAIVISGNNNRGPVMDEIEWVGSRAEHAEGAHMREAFEHALHRQIMHPSIFHQSQSGYIEQAAEFMRSFHRQMKPSLRAAEEMSKALEKAILGLDVDNLNGDKAILYLRQFQQSIIDRMTVQQMNISDTKVEAVAQHVEESEEKKTSHSPRFH